MMRITRHLIIIALLMVCLTFSSVWAETGVSDKEIVIGAIMNLTGPGAYGGNEITRGISTYFKAVNDKGGVYGRKIKFVVEDNSYQVAKTQAAYKKLKSRDQIFGMAGNIGSSPVEALFQLFKRDKIPLIGSISVHSHDVIPRYAFPAYTPYRYQAKLIVDYIVETLGDKKPKIGVLRNTTDFGLRGLEGVQEQVKNYGGPEVIDANFPPGAADVSAQVLKLKESGVNYVVYAGLMRAIASGLMEAKKIAWQPHWFSLNPGLSEHVIKISQGAAEYGKGLMGTLNYSLLTDDQTSKDFIAALKKYYPDKTPTVYAFGMGYGVGAMLVEGLNRAGKDLTREKLIRAMETFKDYNNGCLPPQTFGPGDRTPSEKAYFSKAQNGKLVRISDWMSPKF
jgi:branched-chain amino acid transport system substrate-binding protein